MIKNLMRWPIAIQGTVFGLVGLLFNVNLILKVQAETVHSALLPNEADHSIDISTAQEIAPLTPNLNNTPLHVLYPADAAKTQVLTLSEPNTPFGTALSVVDRIPLAIPTSGGFYIGKYFHSYVDPCQDGRGNVRQLVGIWSRKFVQFNTIMDPPSHCVNSTGSPSESIDILVDGKVYPLTMLKMSDKNGGNGFYAGLYPISAPLLEALQNNSSNRVEIRFSDLGDGNEKTTTVRVNPASVKAFQQIYGTPSNGGE